MDTSTQTSSTGMSDLINATKGQALNTGALVQANQNLVTQATAQATNSGNLVTQTTNLVTQATNQVTQTTNLVTQTTNLVTQATNQVTQLTNLVTAVTNLTTAINNALSLGPWNTWSPVVTTTSGTITTLGAVSGRYIQAGKTVYFSISIAITTNGTGAGNVLATLPVTAKATNMFAGSENAAFFKMVVGGVNGASNSMYIRNYDSTYPGGNGTLLILSGVYEAQ